MDNTTTPNQAAPLTGRDRRLALSNAAKAKAKETRRRLKLRADGWTPPQEREATAARLVAHVIRRIRFPKYGEPMPLTKTDISDATAAGIAACVETGFFEHGHISAHVLKSIRNAIQSRDCLRLRCQWEYSTDDAAGVAAAVGFATEFEELSRRLTKGQRDAAREIMRTLKAARDCDQSRKAAAAFKSQRDFFLMVLGHMTGRRPRAVSQVAFDTRKSRFIDYLAKGAAALRATGQHKPDLAREIMAALESRALANL